MRIIFFLFVIIWLGLVTVAYMACVPFGQIQIAITQCRDAAEKIEIYVWNTTNGSAPQGQCTASDMPRLDDGAMPTPVYTIQPRVGEFFDLPELQANEMLLLRFIHPNLPPYCESCREADKSKELRLCTLQGPDWCKSPTETTAELPSEPTLPSESPSLDASSPETAPEVVSEAAEPDLFVPTEQIVRPDSVADMPSPDDIRCTQNAQCPAQQVCIAGKCRPCMRDAECDQGQLCIADRCITGNCRQNSDCSSSAHICRQWQCSPCRNDEECGEGSLCIEAKCVSGNCRQNSDCPLSAPVCKNFTCGPCAADSDCGEILQCQRGICIPIPCKNYSECSKRRLICKQEVCSLCTTDSDCEATRQCRNGRCSDIPCTSLEQCNKTHGLTCINGVCDYCQSSGNNPCGEGFTCRGQRCQPARCRAASECHAGFLCIDGICMPCSSTGSPSCPANHKCINCTRSSIGCDSFCSTTSVCPDFCR